MLTYFVHSTSTDNQTGVRSGWNDPGLSPEGLKQAEALRAALAECAFDRVYASDLKRASRTAEIALPGHALLTDPRLREMNYGALNGHPGSAFPADWEWCIDNRFDRGENCRDVQKRIEGFLAERHDPAQRIAVFAHRYTQLALDVILRGLTWKEALAQDWRHKGAWRPGWTYGQVGGTAE